ncbi:DUF4340 domain-containing protein [Desulfogranum japonicum]|uniref:DUF4340 domain-containing protein n=1 Tax=Desulfogranum japonicum TaxID=231447 RepID=UPI0004115F48|nr:DUF4340 domain-containing protein [Desulfogranum japonicum]
MNKIIIPAIILLIVQIGLAINLQLNTTRYAAFTPDAPFVSTAIKEVDQLTVVGKDGQKVRLTKEAEKWLLPDYYNAAANSEQVQTALDNIAKAKQGLAVATTESALARFHVADDDFERHVILHSQGNKVGDFYLGSSAGLRKSHARVADSQEVISVGLSTFDFENTPESWMDKTIVQVNKDSVQRIAFKDFTLIKHEDKWLLEQDKKQSPTLEEEVKTLLNSLHTMSVDGIIAPEEAAKISEQTPVQEFAVTYAQKPKQTYSLFKPEEGEDYILRVSDQEHLFKVPGWQIEDLISIGPEKYLEAPAPQSEDSATEEVAPEQKEDTMAEELSQEQQADIPVPAPLPEEPADTEPTE